MLRRWWAALRAKAASGRGACVKCGTQTVATLEGTRFCSDRCAEADAWDQANGG